MKNIFRAIFLLICLLVSCFQITFAQSKEVLAKSYFLKAQEAYSDGNTATAMTNLDQTVEYLCSTNAKIESLYVKIHVASNNYISAKNHLNNYFDYAFRPIARDGADNIEVMLRLQKALTFIETLTNPELKEAAIQHSIKAYNRAETAMEFKDDINI